MKRFATLVLIVALSSCSGSPDGGGAATQAEPVQPEGLRSAPAVRAQVGVSSESGVLALWCVRSRCRRHDPARPRRYLDAAPSGLIVFATGVVPSAARVEIGSVAHRLRPGTTMAASLDVTRGAHVVTLVESWPGYEARWVFGLRSAAR